MPTLGVNANPPYDGYKVRVPSGNIESYGVSGDQGKVTAERGKVMTPTARWAIAQRRKRQVISRTVHDRALNDPRRRQAALARAAARK